MEKLLNVLYIENNTINDHLNISKGTSMSKINDIKICTEEPTFTSIKSQV